MADLGTHYGLCIKKTFYEVCEIKEDALQRQNSWCSGDGSSTETTVEMLKSWWKLFQAKESKKQTSIPLACTRRKCKPCVYAASQLGCYNPNCGYCHDHHTEANKTRPRKSVRTYWKQETDRILSFQDPQLQRAAFHNLAAKDSYARCLVIGALNFMADHP